MTDNLRNGDDRIEIHYRQQLSALMDGDLPPDEARFLLRRLQHDTQLGDCWERWQLVGETLRGRAVAPLPADFSQRVVAAIAAEPVPTRAAATSTPRWTRWGGGALAASVALIAVFMTQQQSPQESRPAPRTVASTPAPAPVRQPAAPRPAATVDPNTAATLAAATVAVAEVPRRVASNNNRASTRSQGQSSRRVAARTNGQPSMAVARANVPAAAAAATARLSAAATAATSVASSAAPSDNGLDPFASLPIAPSRPWPSATLPQFSAPGAFRADYSTVDSYYPFQPRLPASGQSDDAASGTRETPQR
ncbi:negative regulator of sigma E activity [Luteimonas cucumeris]|uniref:Negative regulator of sigma E activity n=1 Tax=Luteimonas cucumeris TaxID=985012 RepID=A0A562L768_9GAMM|nr:RseA family anti-sigma factor [Luteimonas cucumeris]TWI03499.1 negative regulator of sigma E activity [Luteimonas cucumeris]